ncbi:tRNA (adenosine(37)-N6)-dimethylallyltransferase MiaA [Rhizobium sp. TRM95796]|uniref:tRNA (adenosine(37)-N6)-dimethylallyltransferase MiaA n=1 Tax=Rhizobium sp. TRM95796 TaxID=2979862 RepID=UPI0021E81354|nr:tRNA (adenosine(37)-N6)-dimethylallyltransferase MiaA [Rhizobium sp. TRM95796]MCV3764536.1 tRNA (adenosine(37)-N6)-dimethylallyltransferase MiaA [Rhizobium sp. TRM95796]
MDAILITGPTASGKSALAAELAARHGGEVINADSMQVYSVLDWLTARPRPEEMAGAPHHLYGEVAPNEPFSTGAWLRRVEPLLVDVKARGKLPVFVGGTGLYFKALAGGLSEMPEIPEDVRASLRRRLLEEGPEALHAELDRRDPLAAATLNPADGQRILRALEIRAVTGRSIRDLQAEAGPALIDAASAVKIILEPERSLLHGRINRRFEKMMEEGAVAEVEALLMLDLPPATPAMKAIGVAQIADMLAGRITRAEAIERSSAATRQYAKRQSTWFRNQMDESWMRIAASDELTALSV